MEELPIAIAFSDPDCHELVFDDDLFWGSICTNFHDHSVSTSWLTAMNNRRFEEVLTACLPVIPTSVRLIICDYHSVSTSWLTARNNRRFEAVLTACLPVIPTTVRFIICQYMHHHAAAPILADSASTSPAIVSDLILSNE
jgi:hypothetical protein